MGDNPTEHSDSESTHHHHGPDLHAADNQQTRTILINAHQQEKFTSNWISTGKYSYFSFLPSFIYEQFRRYSNIFFLAIALLQQIPDVSPTGRYTTLVPLFVILTVSALKEIIEDVKRHKADNEINNREVEVLKDGSWQFIKWHLVSVGDFVKIKNEHFFPADIVIFSSSDSQGICYIETANLDGETNLKVRQGLPETAEIQENDYARLQGHLKCELPNRHLYEFAGSLKIGREKDLALNHDQILLRGAKLMNTNWLIGLVVYTGHETKLMKNSTAAPLKRSTVDKQTNMQIVMLFILLVLIALVSALFSIFWIDISNIWYIPDHRVNESSSSRSRSWIKFVQFSYSFLTFLILYNNLIPISLTVTLEVVRFIQALFINWDADMYYAENDTPAMARTSNLNEELGQVSYVFSDKTGTLTRNIMEFKACTVGGKVYLPDTISSGNNLLVDNLRKNDPTASDIRDFLEILAVCHTVIPDYSTGELVYHAASPDERALVLGAKQLGYVFDSRTPKQVEITALNKKATYEILNVLEFTSTRKRMSVIVKTPEGKIRLMSKGADSIIYDLLAGGSSKSTEPIRVSTLEHLEDFAKQGLRTLCLAVADIPQKEYQHWQETFHRASTAIHHREKKLEEASALIEKNLRLVGATAIEDKLQDKVPETIAALLKAGIHVWVLTGDKQETAINIGYSCKLLTQSMELLVVNCENMDDTKESLVGHIHALSVNHNGILPTLNEAAVIIDGKSLKYALTDQLRPDFLKLCCNCKAVICCRASPLQKAEIVEFVTHHTGKITLAIGDGANDVAMIQKAHVGIGISGQEGLQASCASDYAIAQFHFLRKLLFVHGAWNYDRLCKLIFYSYYKNICLYLIELWFAIYSAWSGQIIFERWTIGFYNMMFTCAQPICMGVFDRNCSEQLRLKYPILYHPSEHTFSLRTFFMWVGNSILHSMILFWLSYVIYGDGVVWGDGKEGGYLVLGNFIYTYVVVVVSIKSGLETKSWTIFTHLSIWGSMALWMVFLLGYSYLYAVAPLGADILGIAGMVYSSPVFWAGLIIVPTTTLLPDILLKACENTMYISLEERFRQCDILRKDPSVFLNEARTQEAEDCLCPSEFSFRDAIGSSSSGSGSSSSSPESTYSYNYTSSSAPSHGGRSRFAGRSKTQAEELFSSGDKPAVLSPVMLPSKDHDKPAKNDTPGIILTTQFDKPPTELKRLATEDHEISLQFPPVEPNQNFIFDSKQATRSHLGQKNAEVMDGGSLAGLAYFQPITHPSTHPSIIQTRTKLEAGGAPDMSGSLNPERHQELRTVLQQWMSQNRKRTPGQHITANMEEQVS